MKICGSIATWWNASRTLLVSISAAQNNLFITIQHGPKPNILDFNVLCTKCAHYNKLIVLSFCASCRLPASFIAVSVERFWRLVFDIYLVCWYLEFAVLEFDFLVSSSSFCLYLLAHYFLFFKVLHFLMFSISVYKLYSASLVFIASLFSVSFFLIFLN